MSKVPRPYNGPEAEALAPSIMEGPPTWVRGGPPRERTRPCSSCGEPRLVASEFIAKPERRGWICLECRRESSREWDRANRARESARRHRLADRHRRRVGLLERVLARLSHEDPEAFAAALEAEAGDLATGLRTLGIGDPEWARRPR